MKRKWTDLDRRALLLAVLVVCAMVALVFVGSRRLQNFDAALVAYLFGSLFALLGVTYRYLVWIRRPPTRLYFVRSLGFLCSRVFVLHLGLFVRGFVRNIVFQRFIAPRSPWRWLAHLSMALGCFVAFSVTFPLTFGWIHFALDAQSAIVPQQDKVYIAFFFGFPVMHFPVASVMGFFVFHILDWCSFAVIAGCVFFLVRRLSHWGTMAVQTFEGDVLPLLLLVIISVSGLGLSLNYDFMRGFSYEFMAVLHAASVIIFLIWIPFGKFFHIIQRPAQIGVQMYIREGRKRGMAKCPHTGEEFASRMHLADLEQLTKELGFSLQNEQGQFYLHYSPQAKRCLFAQAHMDARAGQFFG